MKLDLKLSDHDIKQLIKNHVTDETGIRVSEAKIILKIIQERPLKVECEISVEKTIASND